MAAPSGKGNAPKIFAQHCGACHGTGGTGATGPALNSPLRHGNTLAEVTAVIKKGIPGTLMPPSGLPDAQDKQLAQYVLGLQKSKKGRK